MIKTEIIPEGQAWKGKPSDEIIKSFKGEYYRPCRILGGARLVRILSHIGQAPEGQKFGPNREDGSFWFDEDDFQRVKSEVAAGLRNQGGSTGGQNSLRSAMYLRFQLRFMLAVCRDWTPSFDYIARLTVPAGESLVGLVGDIREQPPYDPHGAWGGSATAPDMQLQGKLGGQAVKQYVLNFDLAANSKARNWICAPLPLGA